MKGRFPGALIIGLCLVVSSAILGAAFLLGRHETTSVRVVGAATKRFDSDIVKWRVSLAQSTDTAGVKEGYRAVGAQLEALKGILFDNGIPAKDLTIQPVAANPTYDGSGIAKGYNIVQGVFLVSKDIGRVEKVALNPGLLVDNGIYLQSSFLEYFSSELNAIKKDLLAAATKDARARAERIAGSAGNGISRLVSAKVGVFQITEPYSTEVSDYGMYSTATREKDITVTVNAEFALE